MASASSMQVMDAQGHNFREVDFRAISAIIHRETGIHLTDSKATLVYSRLTKRLRKLGIKQFAEYTSFINSDAGTDERHNMISALTTNVTSFYREKHHFDDLGARVLPGLLTQAKKGAKVRIWSAACSSGEEPYSIAFEILKLAPDAHKLDLKILATDIDPVILGKAKTGIYSDAIVQKAPKNVRNNFFTQDADQWRVKDTAKNLITFRRLNLIEPWPVSGPFDVVFCRNVTIYFDPPTRASIWEKFATVMGDDGQLYIGHSERIAGPAAGRLKNNGVTAYCRINK